jgi:hypothetical protein
MSISPIEQMTSVHRWKRDTPSGIHANINIDSRFATIIEMEIELPASMSHRGFASILTLLNQFITDMGDAMAAAKEDK